MSIQNHKASFLEVEQTPKDQHLSHIFTMLSEIYTGDSTLITKVGRGTSLFTLNNKGEKEPVHGLYDSSLNHIQLNGELAPKYFDSNKINFRIPVTLRPIASLFGVFLHEIGHKKFTNFPISVINETYEKLETNKDKMFFQKVLSALFLLEESRMEKHVIQDLYQHKSFLTHAVSELILPTIYETENISPSAVCALILARVDAGTLKQEHVINIENLVLQHLSTEIFVQAQKIWREFHEVNHNDFTAAYIIAEKWVNLFPSELNPNFEYLNDSEESEGIEGTGESVPNENTESQESSNDETDDFIEDLKAAVTEVAKESLSHAKREIDNSIVPKHVRTDNVKKEIEKNVQEAENNRKVADTIFHGDGGFKGKKVRVSWDEPNSNNLIDSNKIEQALRKIFWVPLDRTVVKTSVPGGKLSTRDAMRKTAQHKTGSTVTAKPWNNKQIVRNPPLKMKIGLLVDQSGSMESIINQLTGSCYSIAKASSRFDAKFAALTFGDRVAPLVEQGKTMEKVPLIEANAPHEAIGTAIQAIDGHLNFNHKTSHLKLLFIASDGYWVNDNEAEEGRKQLARLRAHGVKTFMIYNHKVDKTNLHDCTPIIVNNNNWVDLFIESLKESVAQ